MFKYIVTLSLGVALLATPALAQNVDREELAAVMEELQDVITQLSYEDSLTRTETDNLRRTLAGLYRDLEALNGRVAGYPPAGDDPDYGEGRNSVWTRFGAATLGLEPLNARFAGWKTGNNIRVGYGQSGVIYLTIVNGAYTARWTLRHPYAGEIRSSVKAESSGDVRLTVNDDHGTHEYLVKDGGLGPVYSRNISGTGGGVVVNPGGSTSGVWYKPYRNQVSQNLLRESTPMKWLIQQYQDNSFVNARVRDLGVVLGELEGTPLSYEPIGTLRYQQAGRTYELDIPDPRRTPSEFAAFAKYLYDLDQAGRSYEFDLPGLDR
jgi:hypothetical protein